MSYMYYAYIDITIQEVQKRQKTYFINAQWPVIKRTASHLVQCIVAHSYYFIVQNRGDKLNSDLKRIIMIYIQLL